MRFGRCCDACYGCIRIEGAYCCLHAGLSTCVCEEGGRGGQIDADTSIVGFVLGYDCDVGVVRVSSLKNNSYIETAQHWALNV